MRRYLLIGLAVYVVYLLAGFPAQVALHWFAPEGVKGYGVEGSIWNGRAQAISAGPTVIGETSWRLSRTWLLAGKMSADIKASIGRSRVNTGASRFVFGSHLKLRSLQGIVYADDLPPALLAGLRNQGITGLEGRIGLSFQELVLADGWPSDARGSVDLVELDVATPFGAEQIGSYEVLFDGRSDGELNGQLADTDGPIALQGQVTFLPERGYRYRVVATPKPGAPQSIVQALSATGKPAPGGGAEFSDQGTLP